MVAPGCIIAAAPWLVIAVDLLRCGRAEKTFDGDDKKTVCRFRVLCIRVSCNGKRGYNFYFCQQR